MDEASKPAVPSTARTPLEGAVREAVISARARVHTIGAIGADEETLVSALYARVAAEPDPIAALREMAVEDVVLADACAAGDPGALRVIEAEYMPDVRATLRRRGLLDLDLDDAAQAVRTELLVGRPGEMPKIANYSGRGRLRGYLRAVAARMGLRVMAAHPPSETLDDGAAVDAADLELDYLKRRYASTFHDAFRVAFAALTAEDRFLLKHRYAKGLAVVQAGERLGMHPTTASRRIADARARLIAATREQMTAKLGVGRAEASSLLRLIHEEVDVTLTTVELHDALSG